LKAVPPTATEYAPCRGDRESLITRGLAHITVKIKVKEPLTDPKAQRGIEEQL
jgi:hypothetical protein